MSAGKMGSLFPHELCPRNRKMHTKSAIIQAGFIHAAEFREHATWNVVIWSQIPFFREQKLHRATKHTWRRNACFKTPSVFSYYGRCDKSRRQWHLLHKSVESSHVNTEFGSTLQQRRTTSCIYKDVILHTFFVSCSIILCLLNVPYTCWENALSQ